MNNIAIFASGSGSNAEQIIQHFSGGSLAQVKVILSNNPKAFVLERAKILDVPSLVFKRQQFYETNQIIDFLKSLCINLIVLAGFMWLVPSNLLMAYQG